MRKQKERMDQIKYVGRKRVEKNLTKKARTEEALRQNEERYRTTMMSVGDGVIATDTKGRLKLLNRGDSMKDPLQEIFVNTGEVRARTGDGILRACSIGSCVVVTAYDLESAVGGMAHVMLPGKSCCSDPLVKTNFAKDAIEEMMRAMSNLGAMEARVHVCLIGGGNVLGDGHASPGPDIVRSLIEILGRKEITPVVMEVGGRLRRSCALHVARRCVTYTVGDSEQRTLWEAKACGLGSADKGGGSSLKEVIV